MLKRWTTESRKPLCISANMPLVLTACLKMNLNYTCCLGDMLLCIMSHKVCPHSPRFMCLLEFNLKRQLFSLLLCLVVGVNMNYIFYHFQLNNGF